MTIKACHQCLFQWPSVPLKVVLVEPEIPPNTGNVARLCAATGSELHLIEPLGFRLTNTALRRAGLDYWEHARIFRHPSFAAFLQTAAPPAMHFFSTRAPQLYTEAQFNPGDALIFGSETRGLSPELMTAYAQQLVCLPMKDHRVRSLNLAGAVTAALYEALRQIHRRR